MARKEKRVTITKDNTAKGADSRDLGRTYLITELPASKAEKWAARAYLALANAGVEVSPEVANAGMLGFALYGFQALANAKFEDLEPLMDEMMGCVQFDMKDLGTTRPLQEIDIEEVDTRAFLRLEVLHLHVGFTLQEWLSRQSRQKPSRKRKQTTSSTQTSPG